MIITLGGTKGGTGKSTMAWNFSVMLSLMGKTVLLVNADKQRSVIKYNSVRQQLLGENNITTVQLLGEQIQTEVVKLSKNYEYVIIDVAGTDEEHQRYALLSSDIVLTPFIPRTSEMFEVGETSKLIRMAKGFNQKLKAYSFINRAEIFGDNNEVAANTLKEAKSIEFIESMIYNRKVFDTAVNQGLCVIEYKPKDEKAITEIINLFENIFPVKIEKEVINGEATS